MPRPDQASNDESKSSGRHRPQGFPKSVRIRKRPDFLRVQGKGQRFVQPSFVAVFRHREPGLPRFGLTVSRKVGNAVVRNRVKRSLREAIRKGWSSLTGVDVVFIARPSAATASSMQLAAEVEAVFAHLSSPGRRPAR